MPSWTKEQLSAIEDFGHNIIVSAGAGSGKTAVLSERVITNLKKGMHINEMLLLTFTKAAAAEMRERIRKKISKESALLNELDLIDASYITTFDSFALSIVKKYHYLLNVSSNIGIIDASLINIKKKELLDKVIDNEYKNSNEDFLKLIKDFCIKDDNEIRNSILSISNKLDMLSNKMEYLDNYIDNYYSDEVIDNNINDYIKLIMDILKRIDKYNEDLSSYVDSDYYSKLSLSLEGLLSKDNYNDIRESLNIKLPTMPRGSEEEAKKIKENIANSIKELKELCIYESTQEIKESIIRTIPYTRSIIDIIKKFTILVNEYKRKIDTYEFNDIAIMAINVVKNNKNIREELSNSFKEIMIDEYQDTNDLQEEFINLIENNNVYMVGDIKQSIYRFRNANPTIFKDKYDNYKNHLGGEKIDLNKNFRSRSEVLDNINIIFNMIMDFDIGGAYYKEGHEMVFGNTTYINEGSTNQNNNMEIYSYDYEKGSEFTKEEIEAFIIANDIKNKVESKYQIFDKDELILKDISYNDFVILIDRTTSFDLYKKIFEYMHIPLTLYKDNKMNDDADILVIKNLISFIIKVKKCEYDKEFKYLLTSILRSFLFRLSDECIFDIITNNKYKDTLLYKKALDISKDLDNMSNRNLLDYIVKKFDYYNKLITIANIEGNIVKLDKLYEISDSLSNLGYTPQEFKDYLESMINDNYEVSYSVNNNKGESVKIMTIHKSKGLEYHICYYSGLYKTFNISDIKSRFVYDKKYGIITPYFDEGIANTIYKSLLKEDYLKEEVSEKIRLFYVALTRAKEKMIMVLPNTDNSSNSTINKVLDIDLRKQYRSFLDIIDSIKNSIYNYYKQIDLNKIIISKDYDLIRENDYKTLINVTNNKIEVVEYDIDNEFVDNKSFSKKSNNIISKEIKDNMEYGLRVHEILEYADFKNKDKYTGEESVIINNFLNQDINKNINKADIYHEYEFIYEEDNITYHGIIDLMCIYEDHIDIIDYKLKNIDDDNYIKQLNGYKDYISSISNKKVNIYLYSIISNKVKKLKIGRK